MVSHMWMFNKTIEVIFLETSLRRDEINFRADGIVKEKGSVLCNSLDMNSIEKDDSDCIAAVVSR